MSPRRAKRRIEEARPLRTEGMAMAESGPDGDWMVRPISGAAAGKLYRCPGCDHEIRVGTPHLVVWRSGAEEMRRHWHTPCWRARTRRGPISG